MEAAVASLERYEPLTKVASLERELQVLEVETRVLEVEEALTPGAPGLRTEADDLLQQLSAFKKLLRQASDGVFTKLASGL